MSDTKKNIFITGITSGLGNELLKLSRNDGHSVIGTVRLDTQKSQFEENDDLKIFTCDLSRIDQIRDLAQKLIVRSFDYIVLNAGCADKGAFQQLPDASIEKNVLTNLVSNMHLVHALLPKAIENKTKIVFVSSLLADLPSSNAASYAASKAGLSHFYKCVKKEYPQVPMLCLEIGPVLTPMHEKTNNKMKKNFVVKEQSDIGQKMYKAIKTKTGMHTLSWDWRLIRCISRLIN